MSILNENGVINVDLKFDISDAVFGNPIMMSLT